MQIFFGFRLVFQEMGLSRLLFRTILQFFFQRTKLSPRFLMFSSFSGEALPLRVDFKDFFVGKFCEKIIELFIYQASLKIVFGHERAL